MFSLHTVIRWYEVTRLLVSQMQSLGGGSAGLHPGSAGAGPKSGGIAAGRVELRQAIERLVGNSVLGPVLPHSAEVVIQRAILLGKKHDVVERRDICRSGLECRCHRGAGFESQAAGSLCPCMGRTILQTWSLSRELPSARRVFRWRSWRCTLPGN